MTTGFGLDHLAEVVFAKFLRGKVVLLSPSTLYSFGGTHSSLLPKELRVKLHLLKGRELTQIIWNFPAYRFVSSYSFLITYLYQSGLR